MPGEISEGTTALCLGTRATFTMDGQVPTWFLFSEGAMGIPDAAFDELPRTVSQVLLKTEVGIFDWDLETDFLHHSATLRSLLGYPDDEQPTKPWYGHIPEPERYDALKRMRDAISYGSGKYDGIHRVIDHGGRSRWVVVKASILRGTSGAAKRFVGALIDVTNLQRDRN